MINNALYITEEDYKAGPKSDTSGIGSLTGMTATDEHPDEIAIVSGDMMDAELKHRMENFDKEQAKAVLESKNIVEAYNNFIMLKLDKVFNMKAEDFEGAQKIFYSFRQTYETFKQIPGADPKQVIDGFVYQSQDPKFIRQLLQTRLEYANTTQRLLQKIIQENAKILKLSSDQVAALISASSSRRNISDMKDAIEKNKDDFIKNKYLIDCRSIGAGVMITGKEFEIGNQMVNFRDYIQDLINFDLVVLAHGSNSVWTPQGMDNYNEKMKNKLKELGYNKTVLVNSIVAKQKKQMMGIPVEFTKEEEEINKKVAQILEDDPKMAEQLGKKTKYDKWEFTYPIKFVDGKTYKNVVNFIRAAKKQGFKKIKLYSCNPGSYDLPADLKPGVVFSKRTNYVESTNLIKDYMVAENSNLQDVYELEQFALDLCEEYNIDYSDDKYLAECMLLEDVEYINEFSVKTLFHKLIEFIGKIIGAIVGFIKGIVKAIGSLLLKIKNFVTKRDQRKMNNKDVEVNTITLESAKMVSKKASSQQEIYNIVQNSMNAIAREYRKVADKQVRINKELETQLKRKEQSVKNEFALNFSASILNEITNSVYIQEFVLQEGLLKRIRELIGKKRKEKTVQDTVKKDEFADLKSAKTPISVKKVSSKSACDTFYKNNDFCIECAPTTPQAPQILANVLAKHYEINTPVEFYIISCKDINKIYDLAGDNAYDENCIFMVFPLKTLKDIHDSAAVKARFGARYFNDVVDNNEYREYIAGRHKKSKQIQWIIDVKGER